MPNTVDTTSSGNLTYEMKTFYRTRLLENAKPNLVFSQFTKKYPIPANNGKKIEIRKATKLPKASALTEGVPGDGKNLAVTHVEITVGQYGDYITSTDVLDTTAIDPIISTDVDLLSAQAALTLDSVVRDATMVAANSFCSYKWSGTTKGTRPAAPSAMDLTTTLKLEDVFDAARYLKRKDVKPFDDGSYVCILHPDVATDLMKTGEWQEAQKYVHPEAIYKGELGKIGNVRFVESTNAAVFSQAVSSKYLAVYGSVVLGKDSVAETELDELGLEVIVKPLGAGAGDYLNQIASVGWKATRASSIVNEDGVCVIFSASDFQAALSDTAIDYANYEYAPVSA